MSDRFYLFAAITALALLAVWALAVSLPPETARLFASAALGGVFGVSLFVVTIIAGLIAARWISDFRLGGENE